MTKRAPDMSWPPVFRTGPSELVLWLFQRRKRYRVSGQSMAPTLDDGDHILARPSHRAEPNDIVICRHPYVTGTIIIKRAIRVETDGMVVAGDNPSASTDSESFGLIPWTHLMATVTSML